MALIGKIRKNMWLIIVLLAVALGGFIIQDMMNANNNGSFGSRTIMGEVNGTKIDYLDFQRAEAALYGGSGDVYGTRNSLWNYFVENAILGEITEASGLGVGADELAELEFGTNLSPLVQSFFRNPQTGQVDREQMNEVKKAIDEGTVTNPEFAARFNELRKQVVKTQLQTKLGNLVSKSLYAPTWYAEAVEKINNENINMDFVRIPYESIADDQVKLTDEDYAAYIKKNEVKFTNKEEVRNLVLAIYEVKATQTDTAQVRGDLATLKTEFQSAEDDSLFVTTNGGYYSTAFFKKDDLQGKVKDTITSMSVGQVFGPYAESNVFLLAKLIDRKVLADSARASHILRTVANGDPVQLASAQKYIDSLKNVINSGAVTFADAARNNSQDPGSAQQGGDLGSFAPGMMVPEFNDAVFNGKAGEMYTVTTQFGVHLIKVEKLIYSTNEMKYNVAYISKPISASEETQKSAEDKAMAALENSKTIADLEKLTGNGAKVEQVGGIKINDHLLGSLAGGQASRDIIRWAYEDDAEAGSISPTVYTYSENAITTSYVVAGLKSVDEPGIASVDAVKSKIESEVRKEKKAATIKAKISGTDLNAIANTFGLTVENSPNFNYGIAIVGQNNQEQLLAGQLFALNAGAVSKPIDGNTGVYVAKINSKTPPTVEKGALGTKYRINQESRLQVSFSFMESLKKGADIEDNRYNFY
jgi:peptidyl-prolyl cis-trans isomerase D